MKKLKTIIQPLHGLSCQDQPPGQHGKEHRFTLRIQLSLQFANQTPVIFVTLENAS